MRLNRFQKFLLDDKNSSIVIDIINLFHPEYKSVNNSELEPMNIYAKYDWIVIHQSDIVIGIKYEMGIKGMFFLGIGWNMKDFEAAHVQSLFKAWRFASDKLYPSLHDDNIDVNLLFQKHNVPKPTAQEMYDYYYIS